MNDEKLHKAMDKEHKEWLNMFENLTRIFNISRDELNRTKYRSLFIAIERWAYYDRERRKYLSKEKQEKYKYGLFWNGEENE